MTAAEPTTIRVDLGARAYDVIVTSGTRGLGTAARAALGGTPAVALVADRQVHGLHGERFAEAIRRAGFGLLHTALVSPGESHKTLATVERLAEELAAAGLDRQTPLFVLGGGVTGDLGGFLAASFLRGVPFVQLPTTLLAQVDAAIGGKTGVNLRAGKNLLGAFWQPRLVFCDVSTLATLPPRELAAGLAEVIKYGVIADPTILEALETRPLAPELLRDLVERSVAIKARVVARDEREDGERALLNFGHTVGHAIEAATGYRQLLHGEAVALGMLAACRVSAALGGDPTLQPRLEELLARLGLPTDLGPWLEPAVLAYLGKDKKRAGGELRFVVALRAGAAEIRRLPRTEIEAILRTTRNS